MLDPAWPEFEVKQSRDGGWMARRKGVCVESKPGSKRPPLGYVWRFGQSPEDALSLALGQSREGCGVEYPDHARAALLEACKKANACASLPDHTRELCRDAIKLATATLQKASKHE